MTHTNPQQPHEIRPPTRKMHAVQPEKRLEHLLAGLPVEKRKAYLQELVRAVRNARGMPGPIFVANGERIGKETILKVAERWQKRKGYHVMSHDKPIAGVVATDIAIRFIKPDLMKSIGGFKLEGVEKKTVEDLIDHREQKIPGTSISLRQGSAVLLIKLTNALGEKTAHEVLDALAKRAKEIQKMASSGEVYSKTKSDAFMNAAARIGDLKGSFEVEMDDKEELTKRILEIMDEKRKDAEKIRNSPHMPGKEHYERLLNHQRRDATIELMKFRAHFSLE